MDLLSKEETLRFVRDVLEIPITELPNLSNPSLSANEKVSFLETVLQAYLERQPFQSISLMALDMDSRHRPSWEEIKSDMFSRRGGLCYWHNTFMYVLLESLGCDVTMAHSTVSGFDVDNHVVVLVHGLVAPGDLYLVDVGIGYYIPRPIPLDFADESPVYKDSIMTYKFKKENETKILLLKTVAKEKESSADQKQNSTQNGSQDFEWEMLYYFNPTERFKNLKEFFHCFDICFTDITKLPFHTSPRAMRWSGGRFVGIVNSKLFEEKEEGQLTKTAIEPTKTKNSVVEDGVKSERTSEDAADDSDNNSIAVSGKKTLENCVKQDPQADSDPLVEAYANYFPQFPENMVQAALKNWRSSEGESNMPSHVTY